MGYKTNKITLVYTVLSKLYYLHRQQIKGSEMSATVIINNSTFVHDSNKPRVKPVIIKENK